MSRAMQQSDYTTLHIDSPSDVILRVALNRPEYANAFNTVMAVELYTLFEAISIDPGKLRCVILTGTGDRAFCAGGDLKERNNMTDSVWQKQHLEYERMARAVVNCPLPVIGAINGAAYGGGFELCALTDFSFAVASAKFALPETSLGIIPGAGGTQTVTRAIGSRRAKELILSGLPITAQQALDWGLLNAVLPNKAELDGTVMEVAERISANAPIAVRQAKYAIQEGQHLSLADGMNFEIQAYNQTIPTTDRREGVKAFNEKRKPVFIGE